MKLKHFTIGALALIGAGEIIRRVVQGTAWALSVWGGWDATEATQAAELIAGVVAQRDELLDALSGIISATTDGTCTTPLLNAFEAARVTLAKYKPEQP